MANPADVFFDLKIDEPSTGVGHVMGGILWYINRENSYSEWSTKNVNPLQRFVPISL